MAAVGSIASPAAVVPDKKAAGVALPAATAPGAPGAAPRGAPALAPGPVLNDAQAQVWCAQVCVGGDQSPPPKREPSIRAVGPVCSQLACGGRMCLRGNDPWELVQKPPLYLGNQGLIGSHPVGALGNPWAWAPIAGVLGSCLVSPSPGFHSKLL